jgi:predicted Zn-dependent protease
MQGYFYQLADHLDAALHEGETSLLWLDGEASSFVRFSKGKVRQPGNVTERKLHIDLIARGRQAGADMTLAGEPTLDRERLDTLVASLRSRLEHLPEDPYLLYNTRPQSTEQLEASALPPAEQVVDEILAAAGSHDLVGFYAHGTIYKGFASSLGQRNWFSKASFNFDWSLYAQADKAVKSRYAGFSWDRRALLAKMQSAAAELEVLRRPAKTIQPGRYRVYLAPAALWEVLQLLGWASFGLKAQRTKQTALLRLIDGSAQLHPSVTLSEATRAGGGPGFQPQGFVKPNSIELVRGGKHAGALVSPRSAKEYGVETNGATAGEQPSAFELAAGDVPSSEAAQRLGTGVWVNNLWYLNFSDRAAGRMTGMTRFATFWVEDGEIAAPLNVMRFDETIYRMLGEQLLGLTRERELMFDPETYHRRSTASAHLPGALVDGLAFTL